MLILIDYNQMLLCSSEDKNSTIYNFISVISLFPSVIRERLSVIHTTNHE